MGTQLHKLLLAISLVLASLEQAQALELFGRCILGTCPSEAERDAIAFIDPRRYDVTFAVKGDEDVESAVKAASALWQGRNDAVGGSAALITRAQADYKRILAALYNQGHYGGSISITVRGQEASSLAVGLEVNDDVPIIVEIDAGPQYVFGEATIENFPPEAHERGDRIEPLEETGFVAGEPAFAPSVKQAANLAIEGWREQGHAKARLADQNVTAVHPDNTLNVRMGIEPGPVVVYGSTSVEGTERMDAEFVARQAALKPGNEYDPDDIEQAKARLARLGVFSVSRIEDADALGEDNTLAHTLIVQERKLRRIGAGVTLSNVEGLGAEAYWLHRNLFGKAERLRIEGSVSGVGTALDYTEFEYNFAVDFTRPGFLSPDTDFNARLYASRESNETYIETLGGGRVGLVHYYSPDLTLNGAFFAEYGEFEDVEDTSDVDQYLTAGLRLGTTFDNRKDKLDPKDGWYIDALVTPFYEFEYGNFGTRFQAELRHYISFSADDRFVLAGRVLAGSIVGPDAKEIPDNMLFFAGGGGSVRGYGYKNIVVTQDDGTKTGGKSIVEASIEGRARFTERLGAVAFADAGYVSNNAILTDGGDFKVGVGVGLRYYTGLGPLRLDVAVPLNGDDDDPSFAFYAGIGHAF